METSKVFFQAKQPTGFRGCGMKRSGIGWLFPGRLGTVMVKRKGSVRQTGGFHGTEKTGVPEHSGGKIRFGQLQRVRLPGERESTGESGADGARGGNVPDP